MSEHTSSNEITYAPEHASGTKQIWRVFWILLIITVVEVSLGLTMYLNDFSAGMMLFMKGVIILLGLSKAFYIIAYFMHLADEIKNFIMMLVLPILFLVWGIIALMIEGETALDNKTKFDPYYKQNLELLEKQPDVRKLSPHHEEKKSH